MVCRKVFIMLVVQQGQCAGAFRGFGWGEGGGGGSIPQVFECESVRRPLRVSGIPDKSDLQSRTGVRQMYRSPEC